MFRRRDPRNKADAPDDAREAEVDADLDDELELEDEDRKSVV